MWRSGDHNFLVNPTLHRPPDDRLTEGVPRFRALWVLAYLVYPSVRRVSLFGRLKLKLNLTVLGIEFIGWKILHPVKRGGDRVVIEWKFFT